MQTETSPLVDSLELTVTDAQGRIKEIRYIERTETGSKEFRANKFYLTLLKKGFNPPMAWPFGIWQPYKELTNGNS